MTRASLQSTFSLIATYLFILLFVYAAVSKLIDFDTFETQLGQSPLLSAYAQWVAWLVPISELLIALCLCIPRFRTIGLYGFYVLMVMFTTYIIIILNFTSFTPCSCGGVLEDLGWTEHLIFNCVFIVLSGVSLFFYASNKRKTLIKVSLLTLFGITIVAGIFLSSEKQIKRNNAFIRRYMPHPIEKIWEHNLEYNSYYLAGVDEKTIYIGNFNAPLFMMSLDTKGKQINKFQVEIDSMHLPFTRVGIRVVPPYYYVGDGTVPVLFRGTIGDWKSKVFSYDEAYFDQFVVSDSLHIGITTVSSETMNIALGSMQKINDSIVTTINKDLIKKQTDGTFGSDGILLWNDKYQQFIYTYYYQNSFEVTNKDLSYQFTGKTIDTISKPILDIAYYDKTDEYKLGATKSIRVNKKATTYGNYLYIHSDRLGKYEDEDVIKSASIIDVYNISDKTYAFSFYLYHQANKTLSEFRIYNDILVAIVDDKLWLYRLKQQYFNYGSNTKYTAQYQD